MFCDNCKKEVTDRYQYPYGALCPDCVRKIVPFMSRPCELHSLFWGVVTCVMVLGVVLSIAFLLSVV